MKVKPVLQQLEPGDDSQLVNRAMPVVIINEDLARRYWPAGDALGKQVRLVGDTVTRQIVGVVRNRDYSTLGEAPQPCLYLPLRQNPGANVTLYVQTAEIPRR